MRSVVRWIESQPQLTDAQIRYARLIWGIFGIYTFRVLFREGYAFSRQGAFFNLPILSWFPLLPPVLHSAIILTVLPAALLVFSRRYAWLGALVISAVLLYVTVSDYFGFRHLWVYLGNVYFLLSLVFLAHKNGGPARRLAQKYATFTFRSFVSAFYLITATAKLNSGFLRGTVTAELTGRWKAPSTVHAVLSAIPHAPAMMAIATVATELFLATGLFIPYLRPAALCVGAAFHVIVPIAGKVAPDLNFFMVATYLFFVSNRPVRVMVSGEPTATLRRLDVLRRVHWDVMQARDSTRERSGLARAWGIAWHVAYLNPVVVWYVLMWFYYLLPLDPWTHPSMPGVYGVTFGVLLYDLIRACAGSWASV